MVSVRVVFLFALIILQSCGNISQDVGQADEPSEPVYVGQPVTIHPWGDPLHTVNGKILYGWDPFVIYDAQDSLFKMWYTIYRYKVLGIGYAGSGDGITWNLLIDDALPHVLTPTKGSWDRYGVETVSILKKDGIYMMWYLGYPGDIEPGKPGRHNQIGLATSPDGIHWNKLPGPVLAATQP